MTKCSGCDGYRGTTGDRLTYVTTGRENLKFLSEITGESIKDIASRNNLKNLDPKKPLKNKTKVTIIDPNQLCKIWNERIGGDWSFGFFYKIRDRFCDLAKDFDQYKKFLKNNP